MSEKCDSCKLKRRILKQRFANRRAETPEWIIVVCSWHVQYFLLTAVSDEAKMMKVSTISINCSLNYLVSVIEGVVSMFALKKEPKSLQSFEFTMR